MAAFLEHEFYEPSRLDAILEEARKQSHGLFRTWLQRRLRLFFSDFDVNAWLGMYPMTYLTTEEWKRLLPDAGGRLLDVGAGSGDLTRSLAPLFSRVVCTETSKGAARRLARAGFETHLVDLAEREEPLGEFDAVALLHVLDRCDRPLALLDRALAHLARGGLLLVATPLPYDPIVYRGGSARAPVEPLFAEELDEPASRAALARLLEARGLTVERIARVPYVCPGDAETPYYTLDSTLFVATRRR